MKHSKTIMRRAGMFLIAVGTLCAQFPSSSAEGVNPGGESEKTSSGVTVRVENLDPFVHETHIEAGSDLKSIKFEGIKRVHVATQLKITLDPVLCQNETQDPGGSLFCPEVEPLSYEPAYQVTYSYEGQPLASDEHADRHFTFSVLFHPEELDGAVPGSFLANKRVAAESLQVDTSRESRQGFVIDAKASTFCAGHYADAEWMYDDPACHDKLVLRKVTIPDDYVTVNVEVLKRRASTEPQH